MFGAGRRRSEVAYPTDLALDRELRADLGGRERPGKIVLDPALT